MRNSLQGAAPGRRGRQGLPLTANKSKAGPVTRWLWGTGKRRVQGETTARDSGAKGLWEGCFSLGRGSAGGAHLEADADGPN